MLIDFLLKREKHGCWTDADVGVFPFFSNNNLSIRRCVAADVDGYDENLSYAEDFDICARVLKSGWVLFANPDIQTAHRARQSLRATMTQWWHYGFHAAKVYRKHHPSTVEIFRLSVRPKADDFSSHFKKIFYRDRVGVSAFVIVHNFWFLHFAALAWIGSVVWRAPLVETGLFGCMLLSLATYLWPDLRAARSIGWWSVAKMAFTRYCVNLAFTMGGLISGLARRSVYLGPYIYRRQTASGNVMQSGSISR